MSTELRLYNVGHISEDFGILIHPWVAKVPYYIIPSKGSDLALETKKYILSEFYHKLEIVISDFFCTIPEVQDLKS